MAIKSIKQYMKADILKLKVADWLKTLKLSTSNTYFYGLYRYREYIKLEPEEYL